MTDINPDLSSHVETVVKLSLKKDTPKIEVTMKPDEESNYTPEEKATYPKIKEDEKTRGELDKELHTQIAKIADNPMIYSVLAAADQLIENIIAGTRDYIMKKNRPEFKVDEQHRLLVEAIINNDEKGAEQYMSEHMEIIEKCMDEMQKNSNNKRPANGIVIGGE